MAIGEPPWAVPTQDNQSLADGKRRKLARRFGWSIGPYRRIFARGKSHLAAKAATSATHAAHTARRPLLEERRPGQPGATPGLRRTGKETSNKST